MIKKFNPMNNRSCTEKTYTWNMECIPILKTQPPWPKISGQAASSSVNMHAHFGLSILQPKYVTSGLPEIKGDILKSVSSIRITSRTITHSSPAPFRMSA
jgi:hypothetical protein